MREMQRIHEKWDTRLHFGLNQTVVVFDGGGWTDKPPTDDELNSASVHDWLRQTPYKHGSKCVAAVDAVGLWGGVGGRAEGAGEGAGEGGGGAGGEKGKKGGEGERAVLKQFGHGTDIYKLIASKSRYNIRIPRCNTIQTYATYLGCASSDHPLTVVVIAASYRCCCCCLSHRCCYCCVSPLLLLLPLTVVVVAASHRCCYCCLSPLLLLLPLTVVVYCCLALFVISVNDLSSGYPMISMPPADLAMVSRRRVLA
jgi:hypothetical protein